MSSITHPSRIPACLAGTLLAVLLAGCATHATHHDVATRAPAARVADMQPASERPAPSAVGDISEHATEPRPTLVRGNDRMFRAPSARPVTRFEGGQIALRFDNTPITDIVHAILGDLLQVPYAMAGPVEGSVTVHTHQPLPPDQIFEVFESLLHAQGLTIARDTHGVHHVGRPENLRGVAPALGRGMPSLAGRNLVIVPLHYVGAAEMADILEPLAGPDAIIRRDGFRNLLLLAGSRSQIEGWLEIVSTFDVDVLQGMSLGLFPLQHVSAGEIEQALSALLSGADSALTGAGETGNGNSSGPVAGLVRLMVIENLNAILVITPRAHYLDTMRDWIARFDRPDSNGIEPRLYVYPVQNGEAQHLAHLLNAVFGGRSQAARMDPVQRPVAPGLAMATLGTDSGDGERIPSLSGNGTESGPEVREVVIDGGVRVVADVRNNALLVFAPPSQYGRIEAALRKLDVSPAQVLIEASILEVSLTDDLQYGLQWYFSNGLGGGRTGIGILGNAETGQITTGGPGFSYTITNPAGEIRAVIRALAERSLINVISSPSLMVQDNHTASIQVGDQQPVRSATTLTDGGTRTESIEFKDTGVLLAVTPSVNAGSLVSMLIDQSVTDVGPVDSATGQRSFLQRQISSRVAVRSGESLVLGGLIRDNSTRGRQGVPVLQDIPVVGGLFSTTTRTASRTELLVMITPRVIRTEADLQSIGAELRNRMRSLDPLLPRIGADYSAARVGNGATLPAEQNMGD